MKYNVLLPNYNRSILSISSSIMKNYNVNSSYKSLTELDNILKNNYKNIVLLIIDCLGTNILEKNLNSSSLLKKNYITNLTSVFPSTTAAATTAFHSGLSPLENGWIGWKAYFKEYNRAIILFSGKDFYTEELVMDKPENDALKYETIYEKICKKNKKIKYHQCFPKFTKNGANTFEELCYNIKKCCCNNNHNLVSAYWDELDTIIHKTGIDSKETKSVLNKIDNNLELLSKELNDALIIISADHGAINLTEIYLNEIKEIDECLSFPPTLDSRFITFFIKKGMKLKFKKEFDKVFKDKYIIYTKNKFMKSGLLGKGKMHSKVTEFLGDYVVIMTSDLSVKYTITGDKKIHLADHSGMTKEEMQVPLIVLDTNNFK